MNISIDNHFNGFKLQYPFISHIIVLPFRDNNIQAAKYDSVAFPPL